MNSDTFAYNIRKNVFLFNKACEIFYKIIKKCKQYKVDEKYVVSLIKQDLNVKTKIINKFGIYCCYTELFRCNSFKDFHSIIIKKSFGFTDIMGSIYKFTYDSKIIEIFVDNDKSLQNKIIHKFQTYFNSPESFTYIELKKNTQKKRR